MEPWCAVPDARDFAVIEDVPELRGPRPGGRRLRVVAGGPSGRAVGAAPSPLARVGAYVRLTKPRVVELLLVTAVPAMILAADGWPRLRVLVGVLVGGALAAGGANATNCWIERDRDRLMRRTSDRPLPQGLVAPERALAFAVVLEVLAAVVLVIAVNTLAALLTLGAAVFYVFVYTLWLKPRTVQNIVIGGAAGAVPVLTAWAGVRGELGAPAWVMFAVIFFWTPSHFWALAIKYRDDYAAAGIPMLPVVAGLARTTTEILVYAVAVVAATGALVPVADLGPVYAVAAGVLGALFVARCVRLRRQPSEAEAIKLFVFSNVYLAGLFAAIALDTLV
jgi:protoheme IX farnesyltransferase